MSEFITMLTQIFIISCVQTILEMFIDGEEHPYQVKMLSVACFVGSMYLVSIFVFETLLSELIEMMSVLG